tara:strand:+ start:110 stop:883 length:774 start_codon:yes stop_codon:yes gene_type:complete
MIGSFIQGGLGNQIFQIAAGYSHAKKVGADFAVVDGQHSLPLQGNNISNYKDNVFRHINFRPSEFFKSCTPFRQSGHRYSDIPAEDNLFLIGYFQSERYFDNCKNDIAELFSITSEVKSELREKCPYLYDEKVVSIHVRRGDYLDNPSIHPTMDKAYYMSALESLPDMDRVLVFSDDLNWCKDFFGEDFTYSPLDKDYLDLYALSECHHHVIANSSFSWWGAWLSNTDGEIIAPEKWFGPKGPQDTWDTVPHRWTKV